VHKTGSPGFIHPGYGISSAMIQNALLSPLPAPFDVLLGALHFHYLHAFIAMLVLLAIALPKLPANNNTLRNSLRVSLLVVALVFFSGCAQFFGLHKAGEVLDELAQLIAGMLVIHIAGLVVFRRVFPVLNLFPPRILEDLLMVLVYIAWMMVRLRYAGLDLSSLITTSAVMTAIIAFSMQETLSNILGGLALQIDKSINIGDWIKVEDVSGRVVQVTWRHTSVRTRNGEIVILPNSILMKSKFTIVGSADVRQWRRWINFSTSDSVAPQRIINCINESLLDANIPNVSTSPLPQCLIMDYKNGMANYSLRYWLTDANLDDPTDSEMRLHIYATLQRNGYRLVHPVWDISLTQNDSEHELQIRAEEIALRELNLRKVDMFKDLSTEEIHHLANTLIYAPFAKGSVITHQGAVAHWLYVLINGEVDIWFANPDQERRYLASLSACAVFGERGLMTGEPRRATVTAKTDVECYRIEKAAFEHILQSRPSLAEAFANILVSRTQQHIEVDDKVKPTQEHQTSQLLANIRRFFYLD
jgi:small-conductance mechanosensitive channel/CRP-like cAMP-binding protein